MPFICFKLRSPVRVASDILTPSYKLLFIKEPVDISIFQVKWACSEK